MPVEDELVRLRKRSMTRRIKSVILFSLDRVITDKSCRLIPSFSAVELNEIYSESQFR